jgi:hypothetical protein
MTDEQRLIRLEERFKIVITLQVATFITLLGVYLH